MHRMEFTPASRRDLRKMTPVSAGQVLDALEALAKEVNPLATVNVKKLRGEVGYHRLRTGNFRSVFRLQAGLIRIVRIFDRKDMDRILASIWN